ncbi:MAG: radical SAM protein [Nitrospira sp.]|nr:radical SAM protein [Nitrospira sp.]
MIEKLPEGTIGILGEGEDAILKVIEGRSIEDERYIVKEGNHIRKGRQASPALLESWPVDLPYLTSIFPQYQKYGDESIGVQSKRGCPYDCAFCLYPYIEGKRVRYRPPETVVKDISQHYHQWGTRRFWFTDAQFITGKEAYPQCTEILERIVAEKLDIEWSGYIRTSLITSELAKLMVRSGVGDLEVAITSGSQEVLNNLHMGFKLERLYDGCRYLAEAGFKGKVILNYSLNSPKETEETLLQSVESYKVVASILGEERVFPLMFFLGIQPNTDLEQRLLEEGYLSAGYNPLMLTPTSIRKLLYNPAPLNKIIAKACLRAWERKQGSSDPRRWTGSLSQSSNPSSTYADQNLSRGIESNSGRDALLSLEEILASRRPASSPSQATEPRTSSAG